MSFLKKLKSSKSFSVFSSSQAKADSNAMNTTLNLTSNGALSNGKAVGTVGDLSINANAHDRTHTASFFSHTKSFLSHKIKSSTLNSHGTLGNDTSLVNESFASDTNTSSANTMTVAKNHAHETRTLIVYHIDSETEGSFTLTVKVSSL